MTIIKILSGVMVMVMFIFFLFLHSSDNESIDAQRNTVSDPLVVFESEKVSPTSPSHKATLVRCSKIEDYQKALLVNQGFLAEFSVAVADSLKNSKLGPNQKAYLAEISGIHTLDYRAITSAIEGYYPNTLKPLPGAPRPLAPNLSLNASDVMLSGDSSRFVAFYQDNELNENSMHNGVSMLSSFIQWNPKTSVGDIATILSSDIEITFYDVVTSIRSRASAKVVELLISNANIDVNEIWFENNKTYSLVSAAVETHQPEVLYLLRSLGADLFISNELSLLDTMPQPKGIEETNRASKIFAFLVGSGEVEPYSMFTLINIKKWLPVDMQLDYQKFFIDYQGRLNFLLSDLAPKDETMSKALNNRKYATDLINKNQTIEKYLSSCGVRDTRGISAPILGLFAAQEKSLRPTNPRDNYRISIREEILGQEFDYDVMNEDTKLFSSLLTGDWSLFKNEISKIRSTNSGISSIDAVILLTIPKGIDADSFFQVVGDREHLPDGTIDALIKSNRLELAKRIVNMYPSVLGQYSIDNIVELWE
jgi:hypothetical protein